MELKKILHADDDEDIRAIMQLALEISGQYDVRQCPDGFSAVSEAREYCPDLLLLDYMMPGMTGEEVWREVIRIPGLEKIPAIFLTAKADKMLKDRLVAEGAAAVLDKPFEPLRISDQIREIWLAAHRDTHS